MRRSASAGACTSSSPFVRLAVRYGRPFRADFAVKAEGGHVDKRSASRGDWRRTRPSPPLKQAGSAPPILGRDEATEPAPMFFPALSKCQLSRQRALIELAGATR